LLFVFQTTSKQSQEPSHQLQKTSVSSDCYNTPEEDTTSINDKCRQQKDQSVVLSNVLTSNMNDRENVDENEDDDVLCSLSSRHSYDVDCKTFSGAGDVVSVQQINDDTETQNTCEQMTCKSKTTHTNDKQYICDVCHKGFTQRSHLNRHKRTMRFGQLESLKTHMRTHSGERPYVCVICSKAFASSSILARHKRVHSGASLHTCDVCHARISHLSDLRKHKRIHTGERPYVCDICTKAYATSSALAKHAQAHTTRYVCDTCREEFTTYISMIRHKRTHTTSKLHACDVCSESFSLFHHLTAHKQMHTRIQSMSTMPSSVI